jgi:hypothetical protein
MSARRSVGLVGAISLGALLAQAGTGCGSGTGASDGAGGRGGAGVVDGGPTFFPGSDGGGAAPGPVGVNNGLVTVQPANATLDVTGPANTLAYSAFLKGSTSPSAARWFVDDPSLGSIDASGVFTASARAGGVLNVTAQVGQELGSTSLTLRLKVRENPGGIDTGTQTSLENGGTADAAFRWLYPYDRTVFPRGLGAPTLQWGGLSPDAILVRVRSPLLDYTGFYKASAPSQLDLPSVLWTAITASARAGDAVSVEVTKASAGKVTGPARETWSIAQGSLKGTVYYNTYTSPKANGVGAIMRIKPGTDAEVFIGGSANGCTVCHTVSANGSTLTASHGTSDVLGDYNPGTSYDLSSGAAVLRQQPDSAFSFGALTPDGRLLLSNGAMTRTSPSPLDWTPNVPGQTQGPRPSHLVDPRSGLAVPASGFDGAVTYALMPTFAPDGKQVAFNHYDTGSGHSLAVMGFDQGGRAFSGLRDVVTDPSAYLGWPSFTPDGAALVFEADSRQDFATWQGARSDLSIVDVASRAVARLDALNGYASGAPYLPYGEGEAHLNFDPTILPVAVGGYFWVVFTSLREYGNTITDPIAQDVFTRRRKLWVAAIDIPGASPGAGRDVSHPAFYLPGQELAAGNMRGFWALDPCKAKDQSCASGAECCDGFCRPSTGGALVCVAPPTGCAQEYEKCTADGDCCGAGQGFRCVNGHCSQPAPR